MKNIVVLSSGEGSNLKAISTACDQKKIDAAILAVFSEKTQAPSLGYAQKMNISTHVLKPQKFANRETFDRELISKIDIYFPDLIVLSGYMHIFSSIFITHYIGRLINIHPSLLPRYPGLDTYQKVLENRDKKHGTSIHFVTKELDSGPLILQSEVPVFENDNKDKLKKRVKIQEHIIYPLVISWFINGRLKMHNNSAWLDNIKIPKQGYKHITIDI